MISGFLDGDKYFSDIVKKNTMKIRKNDKIIAIAYKQKFVTAISKTYDIDIVDCFEVEIIVIMIVLIDIYICETGKGKLLLGEEVSFN